MSQQCTNLQADRAVGDYWERKFGKMAAQFGHVVTANQINRASSAAAHYIAEDGSYRRLVLPDFVVWSFPGQHHEIKHKSPAKTGARRGCYGLERYRFDSLKHFQSVTQQSVYYTIHDHEMAGGKSIQENRLADWLTLSVSDMDGTHQHTEEGQSWCNGKPISTEIMYWHQSLFVPLSSVLDEGFKQSVLATHPLQLSLHQKHLELGQTEAEINRLRAELLDERRRRNALLDQLKATAKPKAHRRSEGGRGGQGSLFLVYPDQSGAA
jgi:hypothetical protein